MQESSVERALAVFELFEREQRPLSVKEIAHYCAIPASTCYALVQTLLRRSYLYQTGPRRDFYPTRKLNDMGETILAHDPVLQRLRPVMETLRDRIGETVMLGKRRKDEVVYLDIFESRELIRYSARVGDIKPLQSSSIGKALLSIVKPAELRAWLEAHPPAPVTGSTLTDIDELLRNIEAGRAMGCFITRGENVPDVTAVAALLAINRDFLGITVAGPSHRMDGRLDEIAAMVRDTIDTLTAPEAR